MRYTSHAGLVSVSALHIGRFMVLLCGFFFSGDQSTSVRGDSKLSFFFEIKKAIIDNYLCSIWYTARAKLRYRTDSLPVRVNSDRLVVL